MTRMPEPAERPSRRTFLRGTALVGAASVVQVLSSASGASAAEDILVGDGVTDDAPALQRMYDAGVQPQFAANRTYLLNSPVFLDRQTSLSMLVLELNGAILRLGPNLPTTDAFSRDPSTRWAFFPNTKRTALSGGKVTVSTSTRASGTNTGGLIGLVVNNGTVDGAKANVGFAFSNRTGARFESVILLRARTLLSWTDYCDVNVFRQCHNRAGGPAESVLIEQISSGDGLLMQSCKSDASVGLARLKYCRGAEISGAVTGRIELESCSGIQIRSGHQETPITNRTMIDIRSSDVVIDSTVMYLSRGAAGSALEPAIRITDNGSPASSVVLRDCIEMRALVSADEALGRFLSIEKAVAGTRVEMRGQSSVLSVRGVGGVWNQSVGSSFGGFAAVQAAVDKALATVGSGNFALDDQGSGWAVTSTALASSVSSTAPALSSLSATDDINGSLGSGGYRYRFQGRLSNGKLTPVSDYSDAVAPKSGALRFLLAAKGGPQELRIWRFAGSSTTPDASVVVPAAAVTHTLYDTGDSINGFVWNRGSAVTAPAA